MLDETSAHQLRIGFGEGDGDGCHTRQRFDQLALSGGKRKEAVENDVRRQQPRVFHGCEQTRIAKGAASFGQTVLNELEHFRKISAQHVGRGFFHQLRDSGVESPISRDSFESRGAQLFERLLNQQMDQCRGRGGRNAAAAVEEMRERHHLTGSNGGAGSRKLVSKMLRHGRRRRDQPGAGRSQEAVERQPRFSGRGRSGDQKRSGQIKVYCLPPVNCGARSFIIFSNFSRCAGLRICMMRVLPVERRSSSCSCRLS